MANILITGASGTIGRALSADMTPRHRVLCFSRSDPELDLRWIRGQFGAFEDLRQLDDETIDAVIHLAAAKGGGSSERDKVLVNVEGTRCLMRYLIDRGCKKFVLASSITAVGFQGTAFRPLQVPIPDEHPCLDRNGYGLSKFLMEEISKYCTRQADDIDVVNLRLCTVFPEEGLPPLKTVSPLPSVTYALGGLTVMALPDAVRAFSLAAEAPLQPGVRILNAAGPKAWAAEPVADILRHWWGDAVDVAHFERPGHEFDSVFTVDRIREELGFVARWLPENG